jgi:hypothetical protein
MILSDVEETVTTVEIDEETFEEIVKVSWLGMQQSGAVQWVSLCMLVGGGIWGARTAAPSPASPATLLTACLQTNKRFVPDLFVRGDGVILISPPLRQ